MKNRRVLQCIKMMQKSAAVIKSDITGVKEQEE
jgi:hypothetical protein